MKMYRYTEEDRKIIMAARRTNKDKRAEKRLHALELRASGKSAAEVAKAVGFHAAYITQLTSKYQKGGIEAIAGNHYGGNRKNMTPQEESSLLEPFRKKAENGQIVEVSEIKAAYEQAVGHTIGGSQIYRVLRRNNWRKVMPRSKHPKKASEEAIEASKKLKPKSNG
jgi:transposase